MIAGGHAFPVRSLAIARSLFRIHCVGRGCAPFFSAHSFGIPSGEGGRVCRRGGLAARPSTRLAARVLVSPLCSSFIVHPCRSKQEASAFPVSTACLVPHPVKSSARCLIRFAHPSRSSSRRASRRPSRSSCRIASSPRSHLIPSRRARCAARLPPVLPPRRFVQLVSPFSPCLAALAALAALIAS